MSDEHTKRRAETEYQQGLLDGEADQPPSSLVGDYMEGYIEGKERGCFRSMTPGMGMPQAKLPEPAVPAYVVEHLKAYFADPADVLQRPTDHWGGRSAVDYVNAGASWDEVISVFDRLFKFTETV